MLKDFFNYISAFGICARVFFFFMFFMILMGMFVSLFELLAKY